MYSTRVWCVCTGLVLVNKREDFPFDVYIGCIIDLIEVWLKSFLC